MSLKNLFIVSDDKSDNTNEQKVVKPTHSSIKFPKDGETNSEPTSSMSMFGFGSKPKQEVNTNTVNEHFAKTLEMYETGFDSLNQEGYDFYEFYKTVMVGGADNPNTYVMAFGLGNVMDKTLSKDKLLSQSEYYVGEINKVHSGYVAKGQTKKQEIINQRASENENLINDLNLMKQQLEQLQIQIQDRENKLSAIDGKYNPILNEIESKIIANDLAKEAVIGSIETVKNGIINNLK